MYQKSCGSLEENNKLVGFLDTHNLCVCGENNGGNNWHDILTSVTHSMKNGK